MKHYRGGKSTTKSAVQRELREHKSSFFVFVVLRALVIVTLARQIYLRSYESAFLCVLTLLLLYMPSWVQVRLGIELPPVLEITVLCFIYASEILGEINAFYAVIPFWDSILHTINGFLCAAVGFSLVVLLNGDKRLTFRLSPFFVALTAFCFSMTIGVLWEFFEFGMDYFLHTDMQKDTVIHAVYSTLLSPARSNTVEALPDISQTAVNGKDLNLGGYLDIGLIDTMKDLFVNFIGAAVFSVIGYFYAKSEGNQKSAAMHFVPGPKPAAESESCRNNRTEQKEIRKKE